MVIFATKHTRAVSLLVVVAFAGALGGCETKAPPQRDGGAIRSGDAAVDAGFDAAGPLAANEGRVKRYEDEVVVDHVARTVATANAEPLTAFPKGDAVATLKAGTGVVQIAERNGFWLVTFPDASAPSRPLMGWVAKFAFGGIDAGAPGTKLAAPWCSGTKVLVLQGDKPRCDYVCYKDGECLEGGTCEAAMELPKNGDVPQTATYTTVCTPPPGKGAGPRDAGVPSLFGAAHNADGKCPSGFAPAPKLGVLCFMTCKTDVNCPEDSTCKATPASTEKLCFGN